jgi:hypothetical protein
MQRGDLIINANIFCLSNEKYCIAIESTHLSGKQSNNNHTEITKIHGGECLKNVNVEWLKAATIKVLARNSETGFIHFGFIPDPQKNKSVPNDVGFFEWICEDVEGSFFEIGE